MSTIRPLATIAVLAALGVFLALKINEGGGPVAMDQEWEDAPAFESGGANLEDAPAYDPSQSSIAARSAPLDDLATLEPLAAASSNEKSSLPDLPPLPELPFKAAEEIPSTASDDVAPAVEVPSQATPPPQDPEVTTTEEEITLPNNIPVARYRSAAQTATPSQAPQVSGRVPSLGTATSDIINNTPLTPSAPQSAQSGFEAAWPEISEALDQNDLAKAHLMLSAWRNDQQVDAQRKAEIEELLGQLAGTIVYSLEHHLEPPYQVQPGETLTTIAQQYKVPWQLLAKINGIATPDGVQPGQTIKVIRGPFSAEVSIDSGKLVLLLGGRYAGSFSVLLDGSAAQEGSWSVADKPSESSGPAILMTSTAAPGEGLVLSATPGLHTGAKGRIAVATNDAADLYDILSVGSEVTIRR